MVGRLGKQMTCANPYPLHHLTVHTLCFNSFNNNNNNNNRFHRHNLRFFTISIQRHEPSPTHMLKWPGCNRVQITCNTSSACHVQHVVLRATWYKGTAQLLTLTELKSHLFEFYFISWTINPLRRGENPWRQASFDCLTSEQQPKISQGEICKDNFTFRHTL